MSTTEGREVSYAVIGGPIHVPSVGGFGPTLSASTTGSKIIKMSLNEKETLVYVTAKDAVNKPFTLAVPVAYFTTMVFVR